MNSDLFFEGKQYISSSRAAKISGYANDYIGQLCRDGKLKCQMVGRSWYVEVDSLVCHKNDNANGTRSKRIKKLSREDFLVDSKESKKRPHSHLLNVSYPDFSSSEIVTVSNDISDFPKSISLVSVSPQSELSKINKIYRMAIGLCAIFLAILGFKFGLMTNPSSEDIYVKVWSSVNQELEANAFSASKDMTQKIYKGLSSAFRDWFFESKETILVLTGNHRMTVNNASQTAIDTTISYPDRGMVVVPTNEETDRDGVVKKIKQSFSDEVVVTKTDKETGIITPVFKDSRGDDYLFVLVPVSD